MKWTWKAAVSLVILTALPSLAGARRLHPIPHPIGAPHKGNAHARHGSSWTPLTNQPNFLVDGASNPMLLTDGSVLIQDAGFPDWWKLTPDQSGSYVNGTWTQIASLPATYSPLYHSSAVLPDGRMIIEGGEYLLNLAQTQFVPTWTAQGAIYNPLANTWTQIAPPSGWTTIGDAQSVILDNGTYMQANCCTMQQALLNASNLTWMPTGANKFDINDEEGWTLLPNGEVLTVDAYVSSYVADGTNSELYNPATGAWSSAGSTIVQLWDSAAACGGANFATYELGPAVLRPDGTVFYTGANSCGAANTSIYNTHNRTWSPGPQFPGNFAISDGPAALEPNGNVLMMASPTFNTPAQFFEWNGRSLSPTANTPNAPNDQSYYGNMLVLPTGQILLTDFSNDVEIYTSPTLPRRDWSPVVVHTPTVVVPGGSYSISGLRFNGMSQGAAYGDDTQAASNYPLVRITNLATGHVFYSRTHDHSSMAVASTGMVSTHFDVPAAQEIGPSTLEVVANGIASRPVSIEVVAP